MNHFIHPNTTLREHAREVPVREAYDVIICGGGPAGTAAALAAARQGASALVIEGKGCLGGVWTAGVLSWIVDAGHKEGVMGELVRLLDQEKLRTVNQDNTYGHAFDPERMKRLLERLCLEAGVRIRLHTMIVDGVVDDAGRVTHVITESKSGREAWPAKVFVDCSGEGDFAARCGCGFEMGHPETGKTQPFSLLGILAGPSLTEVEPYLSGWKKEGETLGHDYQRARKGKARIRVELEEAGIHPSYGKPSLFPIHDGLYMFMANHEYGVSAISADDITAATLRARAEVHEMIDALRARGGAWQNVRLVATGEQIGLREGRRIHGLYRVTLQDLLEGASHEDGICRVHAPIDVHSTDRAHGDGHEWPGLEPGTQSLPYDIPLRALVARDRDGLFIAGRCISGDFIAHSSYRVTGDAVAMGEAAGVAAAHAAKNNISPHHLPFKQIAREIAKPVELAEA